MFEHLAEHLMCWVTLACAIAMFFVIAGPCSDKPLYERIIMHCLTLSLMGMAILWLVHTYDRKHYSDAMVVSYFLMLFSRVTILVVIPFAFLEWGKDRARIHRRDSSRERMLAAS